MTKERSEAEWTGGTTMAEVVGRAMLDREFRTALVEDPKRTLRIAGASADARELEVFSSLRMEDWDLMTLQQLDEKIGQLAGKRITRVVITD